MIKTKLYESDRTRLTTINTVLSVIFRGGSILLQFALIPLTINYIKPDAYGVWITLASLVGWISMFDVGIGNGLKNKLTESLSLKEYEKGRIYVSTTYLIISLIAISLLIIYFVVAHWISWQRVFNSNFIAESQLRVVVTIVTVFFLLKFVSDIINVVSASFQLVSINSFLIFLGNIGLTGSVWVLTKTSSPNLILLAFLLSAIPFLISLFASIYLFNSHFRLVKPSFKHVDFNQSKGILSLGSQFFILQLVSLIIFQSDNILIAQLFSPLDVTNFNVAYKYFSIVMILFTIILAPYWTAFTESYHKREFTWIKSSMKRLYMYWLVSILIQILMLFSVNFIIKFWVGNGIKIPLNLTISICCYVAISNWNAILASFLNGVGKIRIQIYSSVLVGVLNIPLSFFLVKVLKWGTYAMPASNFFCLTLGAAICFIQYKKIINGDAKGIWNK